MRRDFIGVNLTPNTLQILAYSFYLGISSKAKALELDLF
ncbi:hypothetical protein RintRC_0220 [Richelia intracellularis]|nr:hypothetical protein RintRC_0220 [Richelia intracellularis]